MHWLIKSNVVLGVLHTCASACFFIFAATIASSKTADWYVHLRVRTDTQARRTHVASVPLGYYSALFCALAASHHFYVAYISRETYMDNVGERRNPARWFEYFFSAAIMHVYVAQLSGVEDLHLLFCIFGLTAVCMIFGYLAEPRGVNSRYGRLTGGQAHDAVAFWLGFVPYVFQWAVIWCYFWYGVTRGKAPEFVYAIIFWITGLDLAFAVNLGLAVYDIGPWQRPEFVEAGFLILSFSSKMLLAWTAFGGTMSL